MQETMSEIIEEAMKEKVSEWADEGKTDEEILKKLEKIDMNSVFQAITDEDRKNSMDYLKAHMYEIALDAKVEEQNFITHVDNIWWRCFSASMTLYTIVLEAVKDYSDFVFKEPISNSVEDKIYTLQAIKFIHGRALQIYLEILHLVRWGFADAAYARWRAMYELCCYGQFITMQGEKIAQQFIDQSMTDEHKNDWLKGSVDKKGKERKKLTFDEIQDECGVSDSWKREYKQACLVVHASPQGTFTRLANPEGTQCVSVGQSDYGIAPPVCQATISLYWITRVFLMIIPNIDASCDLLKIKDWSDYTVDLYMEANKKYNEICKSNSKTDNTQE